MTQSMVFHELSASFCPVSGKYFGMLWSSHLVFLESCILMMINRQSEKVGSANFRNGVVLHVMKKKPII